MRRKGGSHQSTELSWRSRVVQCGIAIGLIMCGVPATARPIYDIGGGPLIPAASDGVREVLVSLASEGLTMPTASYPLAHSELMAAAGAITAAAVSDPQRTPPLAVLSVDTEFIFEAALGKLPDALGFQDRFQQIEPLFDIALGLAIIDGPAVWVRGESVAEYYRFHTLNLPDPRPYNPAGFENNNVSGYLFIPFGWGSASIGRQSVHMGEPGISSLMVSDRVPYLDSVVLRALMGPLKLTQVIATIENQKADPDVNDADNPFYKFAQNTILYSARYYEWWFGTLRLASGSQVLIARLENAFQIADILPVSSWHNSNISPNNLSITFDASWQMIPTFGLFGSVGIDEVNLTFGEISDPGPPTTLAGILGARWTPKMADLLVTGELGSTHYLWGSFYDDEDILRAIWRRFSDVTHQSMPLTSPYGPGASWASFDASWFPYADLELTAGATGIIWDPRADLYGGSFATYPAPAWPWPCTIRVSLGANYDLPLGFSAHVRGGFEADETTTDWGVEIGASWGYHGRTEIPGPFAR